MNSDELFWRVVLASKSLEDALLLWWLAAIGADEDDYRAPDGTFERLFKLGRKQIARSRVRLGKSGLVAAQLAWTRRTAFNVDADNLIALLVQSVPVDTKCQLGHFEPMWADPAFGLSPFAAWSRIALIRRNRDEAILLAWLHQCDADVSGVVATTRQIESHLLSLVDRCTVMRAMARLSDAGLVRIEPLGREGARYHLDAAAVVSLLATFPFHEDAATVLPGWSNLDFPLLSRIASSLAATPSASSSHVAQADDPASAAIASLEAQT